MRNAETVLGIVRERGKQGKPLEDIYRMLYNRDLYLAAYAHLYANKGAMTPGTTAETVDGMSLAKIDAIIAALRQERYRWKPVRRVYIPKANGKQRPLGLPSWSDKLLQEVMRSILEAYYEPQLSDHAHGFRPERGCHTAFHAVVTKWTGVRWFIEGDIKQFFDRIDHDVLLSILREKLHDNRFLRLVQTLLRAGYVEDWRFGNTLSGAPQGGVVSPILSNIYLDKLDRYVETVLIPAHTRGTARARNPRYHVLNTSMVRQRKQGNLKAARELRKQKLRLPSSDPYDPGYRRLHYVRYADDFLLGFIGPKVEAEAIKRQLGEFLCELKLDLSQEKTLVTHATTQAARFLGYDIINQQAPDKLDRNGRRCVNGRIGLRVPPGVIKAKCDRYRKRGKPVGMPGMHMESDYSIVARFQQEYRGIVQYYAIAHNSSDLWKLHWVMKQSLLMTLADKHKTSRAKLVKQYQTTIQTRTGEALKCLEVVVERSGKKPLIARFGGISLRRQVKAILDDHPATATRTLERNELLTRLLANECELCGAREHIEVHHIRKLANLKVKGRKDRPAWVKRMIAMRRKTLVVCQDCHVAIHTGRPTRQKTVSDTAK